MINSPRYIDRAVSNYFKTQIECGNPFRTKRALQEISSLYRKRFRFIPDQLVGIEIAIIGLTFSASDRKVRRWALNTLAQLGRWVTCERAIKHALQTYSDEAEVLAAAIAALFRLCKTASDVLRTMGFDEQTVILAALQHVAADSLDLSCLPLRVENADPELIKLGLIIVGVNRAPQNLFDPNYSNTEIVRAMGNHHDPIVSQYSVWAIVENPNLGIADLGIDLKAIEQQPVNVQAWIFQLLAADSGNTTAYAEYIRSGVDDENSEIRMGLATGFKESFSASYEDLMLEWFTRELDPEISRQILDHLIRFADRSDAYRMHALDAFERGNAEARDRMLATAAGSALYSTFSTIRYNGGADLFRGGLIVNNNTIWNIDGGIQGGAVSLGGNADNTGTSTISYNAQTLSVIQGHLSDAIQAIKSSPVETEVKKEALLEIEKAKKEPTKDNLAKAVSAMEKVESLATKALGAGTAIAGIAQLVAQAAGFS